MYSALAGTVITAPPSKTNEHLFVLQPVWRVLSFVQQCSWHFCSCLSHPSSALPQTQGWVKSRAELLLLLPVRRKAWSGEKTIQCSDGTCAAGPNTGLRLLRKNQILGDLEK